VTAKTTFYSIFIFKSKYHGFHKNMKSGTTVFNIDNKCFLSTKTNMLKIIPGAMAAEYFALPSQE